MGGILCPILIFFKEDKLMKAKRKTFARRMLSLLFAAVLVGTAVLTTACGGKPTKKTTYTYNEYISMFPSTWNTHNGSTEADTYVQMYTEMGLYDMTFNEDRTTYMFIDEMAKGDPVDVTSDLTAEQKAKYGIGAGQNGKAWKVNLNPDATWENGTKITAEDYVKSMELLLSPEIKNKKAINYYSGSTAIYNAERFYKSSFMDYVQIEKPEKGSEATEDDYTYTEAELAALMAEERLYFSLTQPTVSGTYSLAYLHDLSTNNANRFFTDAKTDRDWYVYLNEKYSSQATADGYILVTDEVKADLEGFVTFFYESETKPGEGGSPAGFQPGTNPYRNYFPRWDILCFVTQKPVYTYYEQIEKPEKGSEATEDDYTYTEAELAALMAEERLYFSLTQPTVSGTYSLAYLHDLSTNNANRFFTDAKTDRDWYVYLNEKYSSQATADGYILVTDEVKADLEGFVTFFYESETKPGEGGSPAGFQPGTNPYRNYFPRWDILCFVQNKVEAEAIAFEDVGIFKNDDYSFTIVFENSLSMFDVKNKLRSNWIVYRPYYEAGMTTTGSLKSTTYGTTSGQYMSYGPYKLASYQKDKEFIFERNTNWYGYQEGKTNYRANQFQTDRIVGQVISNQSTALTEFLSGKIDQVRLTSNDLDTYRFSDHLLRRTGGNTWQLSLNGDPVKLKEIEDSAKGGTGNRRILAVKDFRKGLSLMIDRAYVGRTIAGNSQGALAFLNSNYFYDMENDADSIYRNTDEAKQSLLDLYGVTYGENEKYKTLDEAYSSLTGYDLEAAKDCFKAAFTEAVQKNYYTEGQNIRVNIYVTELNAQMSALSDYMQNQVTEATKGTKLEGKVTIEFKTGSTNRYGDLRNGTIEGIYHSFVAGYDDPVGFFATFTDPAKEPVECGFQPNVETFSVTAVFDSQKGEETLTKTYDQWQKSIAVGGIYANDNELKLAILSELEKNILANFQAIPLYVGTDSLLFSKKVQYASTNANIFVAYGGIRLMTYTMNDGEWEDYCKNNKLQYV